MSETPRDQTTECDGPTCLNYSDLCCKRGSCGGEEKKFDPQIIRRIVDGVIIEDYQSESPTNG